MKKKIIGFTWSLIFIFLISACCVGVDCDVNGGLVELRLLHNGEVAIGPSGPLTEPDSISFHPDGFAFLTNPVLFFPDNQSIELLLNANTDYILVLDEYGIDTVSVTAEQVGKGSCGCFEYKVTSVMYNGEVICVDECEGVIDVEI